MAFRSHLTSILRIRKLETERKELQLQIANARLSDRLLNEALAMKAEQELRVASVQTTDPVDAVELHHLLMRRTALQRTFPAIAESIRLARTKVQEARHQFERARLQQRQVEIVYERDRSEWHSRNSRRTQMYLDEMFLIQWHRNRADPAARPTSGRPLRSNLRTEG